MVKLFLPAYHNQIFVILDAIAAIAILLVDLFRAIIVTPFVHGPSMTLPSVLAFLTSRPLKPEYRESWRTHGLSLAR